MIIVPAACHPIYTWPQSRAYTAHRGEFFAPLSPMQPISAAALSGAVVKDKIEMLPKATRHGVLEQLGGADASITDLAEKFHMTLTGMKKRLDVPRPAPAAAIVVGVRTGLAYVN
jgi:hypothetical protein